MRQQKHKSSRSDYPTNNYAQLQNLDPRSMRIRKGGNRSCSTNSYSSNTTALKSLSEVKDPKLLINFRFVNKGVETLTEISNFRNLTELDLTGNLLRNPVPQLLKLQFLKKLTLLNNRIEALWPLPSTLESLNICANEIKQLPDSVMA
jgi:Leucine-rich repeat (LRR) protein